MAAPPRMTRLDWQRLPTQREKEAAWLRLFGYDLKLYYFPEPITTREEALRIFGTKLYLRDRTVRSRARRGWLAAMKGGACQLALLSILQPTLGIDWQCWETIADYRFLRLWEFNHLIPRSMDPSQFVISGNDVARRDWPTVRQHCLEDTVLLCRECHHRVTDIQKQIQVQANQIVYGYGQPGPNPRP